MTDNEIIEALECCNNGWCDERCPYYGREDIADCREQSGADQLDLINSQKEEIERLKADNENYIKVAETQQSLTMDKSFEIKRLSEKLEKRTTELDRLTIYFDKAVEEKLKTAKAEAIKEFAELVKRKTLAMVWSPDVVSTCDYLKVIDDCVKEMVGDNNVEMGQTDQVKTDISNAHYRE